MPKTSFKIYQIYLEIFLFFASLYLIAFSTSTIFHLSIDKIFPTPKDTYITNNLYQPVGLNHGYNISESLKIAGVFKTYNKLFISLCVFILVLSYPTFAYLFISLARKIKKSSNIKNLKFRKIAIYLTLITTFLSLTNQISSSITQIINGNLTVNFALHTIVSIFIPLSIFVYFIFDIKK